MATRDSRHDAGSRRIGLPTQAAVVQFSICAALYLAVWGILRVLTSMDADAAIAPASSVVQAAPTAASTAPAGVDESPPSDSLGEVLDRTDNARECRPSTVIDSNLID